VPSKNGYRRRRAKGLCVGGNCKQPARPGRVLCDSCAEDESLAHKRARLERAESNSCARCGGRPICRERRFSTSRRFPARHCRACLDYLRAQSQAWRERQRNLGATGAGRFLPGLKAEVSAPVKGGLG
jgi:hypothetical protein